MDLPDRRAELERLRDDAMAQAADLALQIDAVVAATEGANTDDEHDPEGATIAFERQQLVALHALALARVAEAEAALVRWEVGEYGDCARCRQPIAVGRLEARPFVTTCVTCA